VWERLDAGMIRFMQTHGSRCVRVALGLVFLWFVPFLGGWEMFVGLGLLCAVALRVTLLLFWLQLAGTFLVLVLLPDVAFQGGNPLLLTTEGEFVVKNLVLIASGLVVGGTVRRADPRSPASAR
jgi:hypothetical protein